ncbi:hypothetical protein QVD99_003883 [Batrachochytrium dendrobatidis]|nr:hypothetical protein QVD99_003883 [Batrachochytrium dendrobatidis]
MNLSLFFALALAVTTVNSVKIPSKASLDASIILEKRSPMPEGPHQQSTKTESPFTEGGPNPPKKSRTKRFLKKLRKAMGVIGRSMAGGLGKFLQQSSGVSD